MRELMQIEENNLFKPKKKKECKNAVRSIGVSIYICVWVWVCVWVNLVDLLICQCLCVLV